MIKVIFTGRRMVLVDGQVGIDEANIMIEEHGGSLRMKLVVGGRYLGGVNNDGQIDVDVFISR